MATKERSYRDSSGRKLILRSTRDISSDLSGWVLKLELYEPRIFWRKLIAVSTLEKSGEWSTVAMGFLQAQEELEFLRAAGMELELPDLLRR